MEAEIRRLSPRRAIVQSVVAVGGFATFFFGMPAVALAEDGTLSFAASDSHPSIGAAYEDIATGDLNLDGELDVVTVGSQGGGIQALLNDGTGGFEAKIESPLAQQAFTVALSNLVGDSNLDAVVGGSDCLSLLEGNGDGTFGVATPISCAQEGETVSDVAVADIDDDGNLDLVTGGYLYSYDEDTYIGTYQARVNVFLGAGDGTFAAPTITEFVGNFPVRSIALGDFNGDDAPDVVANNTSANSMTTVLINDGDGGLTAGADIAMGDGSNQAKLAVGDFNDDGNPDLAAVVDQAVTRRLGAGDGSFGPLLKVETGASIPNGIALADLNGDGALDIAAASREFSNSTLVSNGAGVVLGDGEGGLGSWQVFEAGGNFSFQVVTGDFFGDDNQPDIVTTNINSGNLSTLTNTTGTAPVAPSITSAAEASAVADEQMTPFVVEATGNPVPELSVVGTLPAGVVFTDNHDGTAELSGTPAESGPFSFTITAANGIGPAATQNFTLTVSAPPIPTPTPTEPPAQAESGLGVRYLGIPQQVIAGQRVSVRVRLVDAQDPGTRATANGQLTVSQNGKKFCRVTISNGIGTCAGKIPKSVNKLVWGAAFTNTQAAVVPVVMIDPHQTTSTASIAISQVKVKVKKASCEAKVVVNGIDANSGATVALSRKANRGWQRTQTAPSNSAKSWRITFVTRSKTVVLRAADGTARTSKIRVVTGLSERGKKCGRS